MAINCLPNEILEHHTGGPLTEYLKDNSQVVNKPFCRSPHAQQEQLNEETKCY